MRHRAYSLLLTLPLMVAAMAAPADTYTVALNHAPPYRIVAGEGTSAEISGFYVDIIREAARRVGIELQGRALQ